MQSHFSLFSQRTIGLSQRVMPVLTILTGIALSFAAPVYGYASLVG